MLLRALRSGGEVPSQSMVFQKICARISAGKAAKSVALREVDISAGDIFRMWGVDEKLL